MQSSSSIENKPEAREEYIRQFSHKYKTKTRQSRVSVVNRNWPGLMKRATTRFQDDFTSSSSEVSIVDQNDEEKVHELRSTKSKLTSNTLKGTSQFYSSMKVKQSKHFFMFYPENKLL